MYQIREAYGECDFSDSRDNSLYTVDVKWLTPTNNCTWLEFFSTSPQLTPEECTRWPFLFVSSNPGNSVPASLQQLFALVFNGRWNWVDKWLYSHREVSDFEANIAIKFVSPLGKWEIVCRQWSGPFLSRIEFSPTKEITPCLSIEPLISHVLKFLLSEGYSLFLH